MNVKASHLSEYGPQGKGALIGKTLETLKENLLEPMKELYGDSIEWFDSGRKIYMEGKRIRGVGANDEKSVQKIQGETLAWVYGDEVALWPKNFFKMCMSRLSVPGAVFYGTCNPESPFHWLKKEYIDRRGRISLAYHHFHLDDNPFVGEEYKANLRAEATGLWKRRFIDGEWVQAEGAIYQNFKRSVHVVNKQGTGKGGFYVTVDHGTTNPCVFLRIDIDGSRAHVAKEYYFDSEKEGFQKSDGEYGNDFDAFVGKKKPTGVIVDPAAGSFKKELLNRGYAVIDADNSVLEGIQEVTKGLNNGDLTIGPDCICTIEEMVGYVWDEKAQMRGEDKPLKQRDHAMDALRYFMNTVNLMPFEVITCGSGTFSQIVAQAGY